jgi:uncharacterized protein (TIGR03437 family)
MKTWVVLPVMMAAVSAAPLKPKTSPQGANLLDKQELRFEANRGQAAPSFRLVAHGPHYLLGLSASGNDLIWNDPRSKKRYRIHTRFAGGNPLAQVEGLEPLALRTNYFVGSRPEWRTDVLNYRKARIANIYPGIDLQFYGNGGKLEYDFIIAAGAPNAISLAIEGAAHIAINDAGDLVLSTPGGSAQWNKPVAYQTIHGERRIVDARFQLLGQHQVRFALGAYDRSLPLVIDPVLSYASYFGAAGNEAARAVATDSSGNVYVAGITSSPALAVSSTAPQTTYGGETADDITGDAFLAKFNSSGVPVYMTFLGGKADDAASGIAVDAAGNAYVTGFTNSSNFPVTAGALQGTFAGSGGNVCNRYGDAFVTKINPAGTQIIYSTFLGGRSDDAASGIVIDASGNAYITGFTLSSNFPTTSGVVQPNFGGGGGEPGKPYCNGAPAFDTGDAFVAKINPTGTTLLLSTYFGGNSDDAAFAIALDSAGNIYIGGATLSFNFPTTSGAFQTKFGGSEGQNEFFLYGDAFITKLNSTATAVIYSTYLGGGGDDIIYGMVVDSSGTVYVTGSTSSLNFPTAGAPVQRNYAGYYNLPELVEQLIGDAFVARLNAAGTALLYSTYLGGTANDEGRALAVDSAGIIYVVGATDSPDFPVTSGAIQTAFKGDGGEDTYLPVGDGFFAIINPGSASLVYSTYFGGTLDDILTGLAFDPSGNLWLVGTTVSTDLAVTPNAAQKTFGGERGSFGGPKGDLMLLKLSSVVSTGPVITGVQNNFSYQSGAVAPGMIFILYGANMGPAALARTGLDPSGKEATSTSGVQILFNGVAAPLVYVSATQSAGIVPYELAGATSAQITVQYNSQTSAAFTVPVKATVPGIFTFNSMGSGTAVFNANGTQNSAANPAAKGSVVYLYGTGEGQTNPPGVDGQVAVPGSLTTPVAACNATVGGIAATVVYCGSVPGVVEGELQMNLQLASNVGSGGQPLVVTIGTAAAQAGLIVYVQ